MDPIAKLSQADSSVPNNVFAFPKRAKQKDPLDDEVEEFEGHHEHHKSAEGPNRLTHPSVEHVLGSLRSNRPAPTIARSVLVARPDPSRALRIALLVTALLQLSIGLAWLLGKVPFGRIIGSPTAAHLSRDAALGVVLGTIGSIVAWRPRWSLSLLPVVASIVAVQTIGLIADASNGQKGFHFEYPHVVAVLIGVLTFLVSRKRKAPVTGRS